MATLDHILLGCNDLQRAVSFVERSLGVRAAFGGIHLGRGTHNALLSLSEQTYLEIIAPDPAQPGVANPLAPQLKSLTEPRLVTWAASVCDLPAFAKRLRAAAIEFTGPTPGSRARPGGASSQPQTLTWQTLTLADNLHGLLPFFIEWGADSPHPSADSPKGCALKRFRIETPEPEKLAATLKILELNIPIREAIRPVLRATFASQILTDHPQTLEFTS